MKIQADQVAMQELAGRGVDSSVGVFGSHYVQIGKGTPVRLDVIKSAKVPSAGFRTVTKVRRGLAGIEQTASDALETLAKPGALDAGKLLGLLKAQQTHLERLAKLERLDPAQKQDGEGLWMFTKAIEKLSNAELAAVFQKFSSAEMDLLQTALLREGSLNKGAKDARMAAARLFNLQALVLKEVSNRSSTALLGDLRAENPQDASLSAENLRMPERLSSEYGHSAAGQEGPSGPHRHDISAANLTVLVETAASSATSREKTAVSEQKRLEGRELDQVTVKQMGDVLRSAELTINMNPEYFFAETGIIENPDKPLPNIWHLAEKGIKPQGDAYLSKRDSVEQTLFPEMKHHAPKADERPVYGAINYEQSLFGAAPSYGHVTVVLKPEVKRRATYTLHDTFLAARATVTAERREAFLNLLDGTEGIPQSLKDAILRHPDGPERRALDAWLDRVAAQPGCRLSSCFIPREIPAVISAHYSNGNNEARAASEQSLLGLLIKCFGDAEATRSRMVTHDNLESLIPDLSDVDGNALAMAALRSQNGKHPPITLDGPRYIEAQIQGPIIPTRDIAEIRISVHSFPGQEDEVRAKAAAYQRQTGIKVVVLDDDPFDSTDISGMQHEVQTFNQAHLDKAGANQVLDAILADTPKAVDDYLARNRTATIVTRIPAALRPAVVFSGDRLSRLLADLLEKSERDFAKEAAISSGVEIVKGAFDSAVNEALFRLVPLLEEVATLPFATEAQRLAFAKHVCSTERIASAEEVRALHAQATAQAALMRELASAEPAPAAEEVLARMAALPAGAADPRDVSAMAVAFLRGTEPPITPASLQRLLAVLDSVPLRGISAQLEAIAEADGLRDAPDAARAAGLSGILRAAAMSVADSINAEWVPPRPAMLPLSAVPQTVRAVLHQVSPALADALDAAHPAHPPFPGAANPVALPQDKAGRKQFLVGVLEEYRQKELVPPERGRSVHGRGHIIRSFFYASAFCNILKEQGVAVDKNAVLLGISGHDLGRSGLGKDRWEGLSGEKTGQAIREKYGEGAAGEAYEREVADSIKGVEIVPPGGRKRSIPVSPTLEAQLLQSADSLDIGRTGEFDQYYFDFLRDKNGQVSPEAQKIRDQLAQEANLLQRMTNPLCANHATLVKLTNDAFDADEPLATELNQQRDALDNQIADELITQANDADNQAFFDHYENVIRANPKLFPLLTKYYLEAE